MRRQAGESAQDSKCHERPCQAERETTILRTNISEAIETLVDYLVKNNMQDIHELIMGEVEKLVLLRVLELTNGNKRQAARLLGMNRNTLQRKVLKLGESMQEPPLHGAGREH